jgi:dipeptidase
MVRGRVFWTAFVAIVGVTFLAGACTDVMVGKLASTDGSVITSHTCDGAYDSRLVIIPAADHAPGEMASVYKGIIRAYPEFPIERYKPMVKLGEIPEVAHTYKIFQIGYPFANEYQVLIGEQTIGNSKLVTANPDQAIMYIEQLEIYGLQRGKTAREVVQIMGQLAEQYGYADGGEGLAVADENELWLFEVYAVGPLWSKDSGKPGAVWCAQRLPDDHVSVTCNKSRIGEVDPSDTANFMMSSNYKQAAIDLGLYDPASGQPFVWKYAYADCRGKVDDRLWRVFSLLNPSGNWVYEEVANYPFSVKPDAKVSLQDVINVVYHDQMAGTIYDAYENEAWYYTDSKGNRVKTPFATPVVPSGMSSWLGISVPRKVAGNTCSYFFVGQCRSWLPDDIGGVLWFGLSAPATSTWIPLWVGVEEVPVSWTVLDRKKFDRNSAWWAFEIVDNLVNQRYGDLKPVFDAVHLPLQAEIVAMAPTIEQTALTMYALDPALARSLLTDFTSTMMSKAENAYWELMDALLFKL